ncbi:MAG: hypothetical protein ACREFG_04745 [Chthoniobacterales bacterium]
MRRSHQIVATGRRSLVVMPRRPTVLLERAADRGRYTGGNAKFA